MLEEKIDLKLLWKRFSGSNLKLFFGEKGKAQKVLILSNLVAFIETKFNIVDCYVLQVKDEKSVYGLDMSMRFKKPEYENYKEVFLFVNKAGRDVAFRALAKEVNFVDFDTLSQNDLNY